MHITRKDVLWNYTATFLKLASSALLLPFILRMMPAEMVGIWTVLITITAFGNLLDFGFSPSFARNVTYIFSGVKNLKTIGFETVNNTNPEIDYGLLKGVISAMRWFYLRMAIILFLLLTIFGTWYVHSLLENYKGNTIEVYISWGILCFINSYNIFTLYYDSLMQGKGLIKKSKQIIIVGNLIYLIIAASLVLAGKGLVAIVSAQASSVIIIRWLSYNAFFTPQIKKQLKEVVSRSKYEVLKAIKPNAVKIGLTSLGGLMVVRSAIIIGSMYLSLEEIASYGISMQLIGVISSLAGIFTITFIPKIAQLRVENKLFEIKRLYLRGQLILILSFLFGGAVLIGLGDWALQLIGSKTHLLTRHLLLFAIIVSFLESNHSIAGSILVTKNEVPFFKASLFSGGLTVILLLLFFNITNWGTIIMIAAPGIAQGLYQNWKWPVTVFKELSIKKNDIIINPSFIFHSTKLQK